MLFGCRSTILKYINVSTGLWSERKLLDPRLFVTSNRCISVNLHNTIMNYSHKPSSHCLLSKIGSVNFQIMAFIQPDGSNQATDEKIGIKLFDTPFNSSILFDETLVRSIFDITTFAICYATRR